MHECVFFLFVSLLALSVLSAYGEEEIFITKSTDDQLPMIDGMWSYEKEWARTSEAILNYESEVRLILRTVHDRQNIYIMLDMVTDIVKDPQKDHAVVCFDTMKNGGNMPDKDDYCFIAMYGSDSFVTYTGGGSATDNHLAKVNNPKGVEVKAAVSGEFDRYSKRPHLSYEFKIPVETLTRSNSYGFYFAVFDASENAVYSWPQVSFEGNYPYVLPPNQWGKLVSPDDSLPEFPIVNIVLASTILIALVLVNRSNFGLQNAKVAP